MLHVAIAVGLIAGFAVGIAAAATGNQTLLAIASGSAPLGTMFIRAIQMVVIPLVMAVIFSGVARLGQPKTAGRLGALTVAWFWSTLLVALLTGMATMRAGLSFAPDLPPPSRVALTPVEIPGFVDFIVGLIPDNPFAAASSGALLPVIVFVALFAAATSALPAARRDKLIAVADDIGTVTTRLVWWILAAAPVGVFGLAAPMAAKLGWGLVHSLAVFIASVVVGLVLYVGLVFVPLLFFWTRVGPARFFAGTFGAASVAFSTTSTAVALPVALREAVDNLSVSKPIANLVVPLGASMYRPGSALFQGAAIVYLAHLHQVPTTAAMWTGALLAAFLVALTVAPVPSSAVVTLTPALDAVGVPASGLAVLLGVDRISDMFRTATNSLCQIAVAKLVDTRMAKSPSTMAANPEASAATALENESR